MSIVHCILAFLTVLDSYLYHVIILVDKVLLHSIDLPIAEKVMHSIKHIWNCILVFLQDLLLIEIGKRTEISSLK